MKNGLVLGASAFQCMRAGFRCPKCNNFVCLHTRQDQIELHLNRWILFAKIDMFCKSIAGPLPSVIQAYIQPYSCGGRIKLIICQIRLEISITIREISTSWKNVRWRTLFDNSNVKNDKQIKQKMANSSELSNFSFSSFWGKPLWNQKLLLLTATPRRSCYALETPFTTLSCFPFFHKIFLKLIFTTKIKTMLLIHQSAVLFTSCHKKYCVYYVSEHLKYCAQINEYWLNKNPCLNIVLEYYGTNIS